jgi:hypothetical protein
MAHPSWCFVAHDGSYYFVAQKYRARLLHTTDAVIVVAQKNRLCTADPLGSSGITSVCACENGNALGLPQPEKRCGAVEQPPKSEAFSESRDGGFLGRRCVKTPREVSIGGGCQNQWGIPDWDLRHSQAPTAIISLSSPATRLTNWLRSLLDT